MNRFIDIKGAYNVRDIGGYKNRDLQEIKWKNLYRAGKISDIPESQSGMMQQMKIKTIIDFRATKEAAAAPDTWHEIENINCINLPVGEGRLDKNDWVANSAKGTGKDSHLYHANRSYVLDEAEQYTRFFEILLDESNYPILYHCTAGKDRTGFATILLMTVLGIPRETIVKDYLLTNEYLEKQFFPKLKANAKKTGFDYEKVMPVLIASEDYIQGAFDAINEKYGTIEDYLAQGLGVNNEQQRKLRELLLA